MTEEYDQKVKIRAQFLKRFKQYEDVYKSTLDLFNSLDAPNKCILSDKISDEDEEKYIGNSEQFQSRYKVGEGEYNH